MNKISKLPFRAKPKIVKPNASTKRAVVMDKKDKQVTTLLNEVNFLNKDKAKKQKQNTKKRQVEYTKKRRAAEEANARCKKKRKSFFRREGQNERTR
ncbi:hypothetical protein IW138_006442 [Coemansia sp. RSA 986]|nr:hypothetical protein LPJ74_006559 [Coemansia sp. RSA 1843]KAJ2085223.1 hypothetical protein IW138_006442 [Coemansia sp. RSA 986]